MSNSKTKRNGTGENPETEKMDKVREILFGHELREVETKLRDTESDLQRNLDDFAKDALEKIRALSSKQDLQQKSLLKELSSFHTSHVGLNQKSNTDLSKLTERVEKHRADTKQEIRDLRTQFNEQFKTLNASLKSQAKDLGDHFTAEIADLSHNSVDRATLAQLFEEIAVALVGE